MPDRYEHNGDGAVMDLFRKVARICTLLQHKGMGRSEIDRAKVAARDILAAVYQSVADEIEDRYPDSVTAEYVADLRARVSATDPRSTPEV